MPIQPNMILGSYKIGSRIGAGGMGEVFLAEDTRLERPVALKVLLAEIAQDEERVRRFVQEAKAASALNHPNILTVYEIGQFEDSRFIATEFIKGDTLRGRMKREPISLRETLDIVSQIAAALNAAHEAGIVHRDIKPENVMLRDDGFVKILDFGIAKLTEKKTELIDAETTITIKSGTNPGMVIGTASYMSPEQARGEEVDARSDVFSFGVVLYEMLTGRRLFTGETFIQTLAAILEQEPPSLSRFIKDYPIEIEKIVFKTLAKNKDERYKSAKDLLIDLKSLQKRLEFEAELERNSPPNKQKEVKTQTFQIKIAEETPNPPPNNLSENFTPIIGREKEIAEIKNLLSQKNIRLLTMTGIGGTGKTTLAKAVAREMLADFADGVFFAELAAVTNPELVASTIAQPIGVKEAGGKQILEVLKDYLREKQMLIVVDNFEQIIDAAPVLSDLTAAAPHLKMLVTSRSLLHLSAEREYAVPSLALPSDAAQVSVDELSDYEAIKLFVERARNAKSNFTLTDENARAVAEICTRLDGLPLAIELAAARVKILSPQAILTKLENRLKLLIGGARDLPARQQTMRGAIAWSYDLLTEDEKRLFRRLAVFAGGFLIEAVETVCDNYELRITNYESSETESRIQNPKSKIEVLDLITSLVDKSLLVSKEQADGNMRFRMLEVAREYALESLAVSGEVEMLRHSHAACFLALGEEAEPHLQGIKSVQWLNCLEEEHDNLRAALRWSLKNDAGIAVRLAAAIRNLWTYHSHLTEGRKWLKEALECDSYDTAPPFVRFKLLNALGVLARQQGDYLAARKVYEEGLAAGRAVNDLRQIALSSRGLGSVAYHQGDFTAARKFFEEGLAISREVNDKSGIAPSLNYLGDLARAEGDYAAARPLFEESLAIFRQLGSKQSVSYNLINLGAVAYGEGDFAAMRSHFAEGLATAQELGDKIAISYSLDGCAAIAAERGNAKCAARLAGAAEHLRESIGFEIEPAERRFRDDYLIKLKAALDEETFAAAFKQGRKLKLEEAIALALEENDSEAKIDL